MHSNALIVVTNRLCWEVNRRRRILVLSTVQTAGKLGLRGSNLWRLHLLGKLRNYQLCFQVVSANYAKMIVIYSGDEERWVMMKILIMMHWIWRGRGRRCSDGDAISEWQKQQTTRQECIPGWWTTTACLSIMPEIVPGAVAVADGKPMHNVNYTIKVC